MQNYVSSECESRMVNGGCFFAGLNLDSEVIEGYDLVVAYRVALIP